MESLDGAPRHLGEFPPVNQPGQAQKVNQLEGMIHRLQETFESLSQLDTPKANYDPDTRIFSNVGGEVAKQAGKVSNLTKSLVTGVSKMVYSYDKPMHQGFSDILKEMQTIIERLSDPTVKFSLGELNLIERTFNDCLNSYQEAKANIEKIQNKAIENKNTFLIEDIQQMLRAGDEMRIAVGVKFMERKLEFLREHVSSFPDIINEIGNQGFVWPSHSYGLRLRGQQIVTSFANTINTYEQDLNGKLSGLYRETRKLKTLAENKLEGLEFLTALMKSARSIQNVVKVSPNQRGEMNNYNFKVASSNLLNDLIKLEDKIKVLSELKEEYPEHITGLLAKADEVKKEVLGQFREAMQAMVKPFIESMHDLPSGSEEQYHQTRREFASFIAALEHVLRDVEMNLPILKRLHVSAEQTFAEIKPTIVNFIDQSKAQFGFEKIKYQLNTLQAIESEVVVADAQFNWDQQFKLSKETILHHQQMTDEVNRFPEQFAQGEGLRATVTATILEKQLDQVDKTIEYLWDQNGRMDTITRDDLQKALNILVDNERDMTEWLAVYESRIPEKERESREEIRELLQRYDHTKRLLTIFFQVPIQEEAVFKGQKIIEGEYDQTADEKLEAIQFFLFKEIGEHDVTLYQKRLMQLCVNKIAYLSYESTDPAKIQAFYDEKRRVLNDIREVQEKEGFAQDALVTEKAINSLEEKKRIDLLDEAILKEKGLAVFEVGGQLFKINKELLKSVSPVFKKMFDEQPQEKVISLSNIDPVGFRALHEFLNWIDFSKTESKRPLPLLNKDPHVYAACWELGSQLDIQSFREYAVGLLSDTTSAKDLVPLLENERLFKVLIDKCAKVKLSELLIFLNKLLQAEGLNLDSSDKTLAILVREISYAKKVMLTKKS